MAGVAGLGIYFVRSSLQILVAACVFSLTIATANFVLTSVAVDVFPTHVSAAAVSMMVCLGRTGAVASNLAFGLLLDLSCEIPIFLLAGIILCEYEGSAKERKRMSSSAEKTHRSIDHYPRVLARSERASTPSACSSTTAFPLCFFQMLALVGLLAQTPPAKEDFEEGNFERASARCAKTSSKRGALGGMGRALENA